MQWLWETSGASLRDTKSSESFQPPACSIVTVCGESYSIQCCWFFPLTSLNLNESLGGSICPFFILKYILILFLSVSAIAPRFHISWNKNTTEGYKCRRFLLKQWGVCQGDKSGKHWYLFSKSWCLPEICFIHGRQLIKGQKNKSESLFTPVKQNIGTVEWKCRLIT